MGKKQSLYFTRHKAIRHEIFKIVNDFAWNKRSCKFVVFIKLFYIFSLKLGGDMLPAKTGWLRRLLQDALSEASVFSFIFKKIQVTQNPRWMDYVHASSIELGWSLHWVQSTRTITCLWLLGKGEGGVTEWMEGEILFPL